MAPTGLYQRLSNYIMDGKSLVSAVGGPSRIDMLMDDDIGKEPQPVLSTTAAVILSVRSSSCLSLSFVCFHIDHVAQEQLLVIVLCNATTCINIR